MASDRKPPVPRFSIRVTDIGMPINCLTDGSILDPERSASEIKRLGASDLRVGATSGFPHWAKTSRDIVFVPVDVT
jgi:hypothetical protein